MQKGVLLHPGGVHVKEVLVPRPPGGKLQIQPASFSNLLPDADPQHLLLADSPFSALVGRQVLLVYDANSSQAVNPCATRLTTNLEDGLEIQVHGDAVAFYTEPGDDFGRRQWAELDNCIFSELVTVFQRGQRPSEEELRRIAQDFKSGCFNYGRQEGEEDEDSNKDDGGEGLKESIKGSMPGRGDRAGPADDVAGGMPRPPSGVDWRPLVAHAHPGLV